MQSAHNAHSQQRGSKLLAIGRALSGVALLCGPAPDGQAQVVVENHLSSAWTSTSEWTLEEDLRLTGPPGGYLSMVSDLAADSRDNIYILDFIAQEIYVFDPEGAFVRTMGGQGEGPGEFRSALGIAVGPGDSVWVADQRAARYSVLGPDGDFIRVRSRRINGGVAPGRCSIDRDGNYLEWWTRFPNEEKTGNLSDIDLLHIHPVRVWPDGDRQDTLPRLEFTPVMADMPSMGMRRPVWLGPSPVQTFDCSGSLWFAHSGEYRLFRRTLDGDTTVIATLAGVTPAEVDEGDRDEMRRIFGRRPAVLEDQLRALPKTKPIIESILVDGEGHLYVIPETSRVEAGRAIDVFRKDGVFVGRMAVPETVTPTSFQAAHATRDYILFAGEDDAGTPYVTRLRIRR